MMTKRPRRIGQTGRRDPTSQWETRTRTAATPAVAARRRRRLRGPGDCRWRRGSQASTSPSTCTDLSGVLALRGRRVGSPPRPRAGASPGLGPPTGALLAATRRTPPVLRSTPPLLAEASRLRGGEATLSGGRSPSVRRELRTRRAGVLTQFRSTSAQPCCRTPGCLCSLSHLRTPPPGGPRDHQELTSTDPTSQNQNQHQPMSSTSRPVLHGFRGRFSTPQTDVLSTGFHMFLTCSFSCFYLQTKQRKTFYIKN